MDPEHEARAKALRQQILDLTAEYARVAHAPARFVAGQSPVPVSGKGPLENADIVVERSFWIGVYPGLNEAHLDYTFDQIKSFIDKQIGRTGLARSVA